MKLGVTLRNMGVQSSRTLLLDAAQAAESAGLESLWITDHIAIPPDDAEGSDGRYLDPLVTLGVISGATSRIHLGTGVLILPYRPPLPTAKQVASLQELSGERLLLGVGIGWMEAEFRALGLQRRNRGRQSDSTLEFLRRCFMSDDDVVQAHGQSFLFRPNPDMPPLYVGGRAPYALERAVRHDAGWMPMGRDPGRLKTDLERFDVLAAAAGKERGPVTVLRPMPLDQPEACLALVQQYAALGVERLVCAVRYDNLDEFSGSLKVLQTLIAEKS